MCIINYKKNKTQKQKKINYKKEQKRPFKKQGLLKKRLTECP